MYGMYMNMADVFFVYCLATIYFTALHHWLGGSLAPIERNGEGQVG